MLATRSLFWTSVTFRPQQVTPYNVNDYEVASDGEGDGVSVAGEVSGYWSGKAKR